MPMEESPAQQDDWAFADPGESCERTHSSGSRAARGARESLATLVRTIEGEIVPRMIVGRRTTVRSSTSLRSCATPRRAVDHEDVEELTRLLIDHDAAVAASYVETIHHEGASMKAICLGLLAPAARELGYLWAQDRADFVQVTVGLCRLHEVLRGMSRTLRIEHVAPERGHSALLVPVPGEQHTFGLMMVAEFLRRAGWEVATEYPARMDELLSLVATERYAVVGLTLAGEERLDGLTARIAQIRRASRNKGIGVMVGGRVFVENPELAGRVGADATARDAGEVVQQATFVGRQVI